MTPLSISVLLYIDPGSVPPSLLESSIFLVDRPLLRGKVLSSGPYPSPPGPGTRPQDPGSKSSIVLGLDLSPNGSHLWDSKDTILSNPGELHSGPKSEAPSCVNSGRLTVLLGIL